MSFARRLHILGAYWGFLLMSRHLGLHWNMIIGMLRKKHFGQANIKNQQSDFNGNWNRNCRLRRIYFCQKRFFNLSFF